MFQTERNKQTIRLEGRTFSPSEISRTLKNKTSENWTNFHLELFHFLEDWFNPSDEMTIHTSGSTGKPKSMMIRKKFMIQSACITCDFLDLKPLDKILLCMPLSFIAGKMMVVRALVGDLDLYPVTPSGHPLAETNQHFRFASMVPLQIYNSMQVPLEQERLQNIDELLIGGGAINETLESALKDFPNAVYASYGMAETVSHIALRRINGAKASLNFTPLPAVTLTQSEEGALIIDAPLVSEQKLFTNDIAEIYPDGTFRILGRKDQVIVTGGLKVQTETLESALSRFMEVPFAITSLPDPKFGEMIVLVVEQPIDESLLTKNLPSFQIPKKIIQLNAIPHTESGKINRAALKKLINLRSFSE